MDVTIYDPERNVRIAPTKMFDDKFAVLRQLMANQPTHTGRLEFHCDQEFHDALVKLAKRPNHPHDVLVTMGDHLGRQSYRGVPLQIVEVA